jgi:hypothetical protein
MTMIMMMMTMISRRSKLETFHKVTRTVLLLIRPFTFPKLQSFQLTSASISMKRVGRKQLQLVAILTTMSNDNYVIAVRCSLALV